jgi:microsomal dipeptidase-like Zn-dependent dipeptidase
MKDLAGRAGGRVRLATRPDRIRENHRAGVLSVFHGIEGAHALGSDPSRVEEVARAGVVFIAPVHLSDNAYGGSSSGSNRGLTALGRRLVERMNRTALLVDLSHASEATFDEALALTALPPLVSHTGVRAVHDSSRNLSDRQIHSVAERGGVIGIMLGPPGLAAPELEEAVRHLEHVVETGGEDAAALGSDFDGYIETPIDASGLPQLTELMLRRRFTEARIRKILGENVLRLLGRRALRPGEQEPMDAGDRGVEAASGRKHLDRSTHSVPDGGRAGRHGRFIVGGSSRKKRANRRESRL